MNLNKEKITKNFVRKYPLNNQILKSCIHPIGKMDSLTFKASLTFICLISLHLYYLVGFFTEHLFYFVSEEITWFLNIVNFVICFIFICSTINIFLKRARTKGSSATLGSTYALVFIASIFALMKIADTSQYSEYSINIITKDLSYLFYIVALIAGAASVWILSISKNEPAPQQTQNNYTPKHYLVKLSVPLLILIGLTISLLYCAAFTKWSYFGGFRGSDLSVIIFYILLLSFVIALIAGGIYMIRILCKRTTDAGVSNKYVICAVILQFILAALLFNSYFNSFMYSMLIFGIGYLIIAILPTKKI